MVPKFYLKFQLLKLKVIITERLESGLKKKNPHLLKCNKLGINQIIDN